MELVNAAQAEGICELSKYVSENLNDLYVYSFANLRNA